MDMVNVMDYKKEYFRWLESAVDNSDLTKELKEMNESSIEDAFYRDLAFGTGVLRGEIGAGTNRMNIYIVRKASQGIANYIKKNFKENRSVSISYDSRIKSTLFARTAAEVYAANGIKVYIYKELMPTPNLSYAVRELHTSMGIMVTASHNPSKYNGYKVYGPDGCQITDNAAKAILEEINKLDIFKDVKTGDFDTFLKSKEIEYINDELTTKFINRVKEESPLVDEKIDKSIRIVYSPLHGTGLKPVTRILKEYGFNNVIVVKEQEEPDGNFTTCPYPNPEIKEAMQVGIDYCKKYNADLLIATDPDCDRVGIATKQGDDYVLLTGNQTGTLLFDFICKLRTKHGTMPKNPILIKTIVTTDMVLGIAKEYGVRVIDVLTGFKYIGEQILFLEREGKEKDYIFGFEESYGYLSSGHVRDKDAVNGAFLIAVMFAYYKNQNISLIEKLNELYEKYGYFSNYLNSFEFTGSSGFNKMQKIMETFRGGFSNIGSYKVEKVKDYSLGIDGLPKSNVIKMFLENDISVVVRPSGTEPKLKIYISIKGNNKEDNDKTYQYLIKELEKILYED